MCKRIKIYEREEEEEKKSRLTKRPFGPDRKVSLLFDWIGYSFRHNPPRRLRFVLRNETTIAANDPRCPRIDDWNTSPYAPKKEGKKQMKDKRPHTTFNDIFLQKKKKNLGNQINTASPVPRRVRLFSNVYFYLLLTSSHGRYR